jgi:hypothetical protein
MVRWILWGEALGFGAIGSLSWVDEYFDLPRRLFGGKGSPDWREAAMESLLAVAVAVPTLAWTRALLRRLEHLESFIRICAWCRKVGGTEGWVRFEEYVHTRFHAETSHGICPDCAARLSARRTVESGRASPPA